MYLAVRLMQIMVMMAMVGVGADAADMMVVRGLGRAGRRLVADDLRAIFAQAAIHRRLAILELARALDETIEHQRVVAEIGRVQESRSRDGRRPRRADAS